MRRRSRRLREREVFCGRGFSPDAFRSVIGKFHRSGSKSIGTEAPPTKDFESAKSSGRADLSTAARMRSSRDTALCNPR
ncbi:hypothetical protein [Lysobacter gummosus]|uniref:hypothetical protein n=1 Tax=Lysobacter gummosus TaxID=262324 RepID=UPI00363C13F2